MGLQNQLFVSQWYFCTEQVLSTANIVFQKLIKHGRNKEFAFLWLVEFACVNENIMRSETYNCFVVLVCKLINIIPASSFTYLWFRTSRKSLVSCQKARNRFGPNIYRSFCDDFCNLLWIDDCLFLASQSPIRLLQYHFQFSRLEATFLSKIGHFYWVHTFEDSTRSTKGTTWFVASREARV